jgi:hypothetical protein
LVRGKSTARRFATVAIALFAAARSMSDRKRPTTKMYWAPRACGAMLLGANTSGRQ